MVHCAVMAWSAADGRGRDRLLERVQRKSHRQVDLISLIPKPKANEEKKPQEKKPSKPEEKKEEPQIVTVVLKVHMHCNALFDTASDCHSGAEGSHALQCLCTRNKKTHTENERYGFSKEVVECPGRPPTTSALTSSSAARNRFHLICSRRFSAR